MAKGKKYTKISKEEWEAAKSLKAFGMGWREIGATLGRDGQNLCSIFKKNGEDYRNYVGNYQKGRGKRKTEQLQFLPPELPKAPKKIHVKSEPSQDELTAYKLRIARKQAIAVNHFISELRDAGFRF
jgi:hypothetical protein